MAQQHIFSSYHMPVVLRQHKILLFMQFTSDITFRGNMNLFHKYIYIYIYIKLNNPFSVTNIYYESKILPTLSPIKTLVMYSPSLYPVWNFLPGHHIYIASVVFSCSYFQHSHSIWPWWKSGKEKQLSTISCQEGFLLKAMWQFAHL